MLQYLLQAAGDLLSTKGGGLGGGGGGLGGGPTQMQSNADLPVTGQMQDELHHLACHSRRWHNVNAAYSCGQPMANAAL